MVLFGSRVYFHIKTFNLSLVIISSIFSQFEPVMLDSSTINNNYCNGKLYVYLVTKLSVNQRRCVFQKYHDITVIVAKLAIGNKH